MGRSHAAPLHKCANLAVRQALRRRARRDQIVGKLHLFERGVALDEFFGAATREADGEFAVVIVAFHADNGADAVIGMADFLAEEWIAIFAALGGWTCERARARGASSSSCCSGGRAHTAKKLLWRIGIFGI